MSVEREMSLAEWCAKLPSQHVVNRELITLNKQLAALADQNEKMRKALIKWQLSSLAEPSLSACLRCTDEALSLPDLATPVLNRIKAEAYREAAEICEEQHTWITNAAAGMLLRTRANELEQSNG